MRFKIVLLLAFTAFSCKNAIKNEIQDEKVAENINFETPTITKNTFVTTKADLLGFWVGSFDADISDAEDDALAKKDSLHYFTTHKKITFAIDKIDGNSIEGHSVVGGNISEFKGTYEDKNDEFLIIVNEIGTISTNGQFELKIHKNDSILLGKWQANSKKAVPIHTRKLELTKQFFQYSPDYELMDRFMNLRKSKVVIEEYEDEDSLGNPTVEKYEDNAYFTTTEAAFKLNPSKRKLKKQEVENLSKGDIYVLRNLIFARHGYTFKDKQLRSFFDKHSWYIPVKSDVKNDLTDIEKYNIDLLLRYEQNAKDYYDVFGR